MDIGVLEERHLLTITLDTPIAFAKSEFRPPKNLTAILKEANVFFVGLGLRGLLMLIF